MIDEVYYEVYKYKSHKLKVINADDIIQKICPDYHKYFPLSNPALSWQDRCEIIESWITKTNSYYYLSPDDNIDLSIALDAAVMNNKSIVVLDHRSRNEL